MAIEIDTKFFGPDHFEVAKDLNNLGQVLQAQGDLENAKKQYEMALKVAENVLGPDHPDVATITDNLGAVLDEIIQKFGSY